MPHGGRHCRKRHVFSPAGVALLCRAVRHPRGAVLVYREPSDSRLDVQQHQRLVLHPRQETGGNDAARSGDQLLRVSVAVPIAHLLHRDRARRANSRDQLRHVLRLAQLLQDHVLFEQREQSDTVQSDEQQVQKSFSQAVRFQTRGKRA